MSHEPREANRLDCIIMGAAGRDFFDFLQFFKSRPELRVVCFTAAQIPFIERRAFPRALAGAAYAEDIPIYSEERLPELIREHEIDFVFLAYSDLSHEEVMHKASIVQAAGASFAMLGPRQTQLPSKRPVISVTAVRTGAGKSPLSQAIAKLLTEDGRRVGVLRHPMPYGDLTKQAVQCFRALRDLDEAACTIEEREEYQPYVEQGITIWAGVDYARILEAAEHESDVILWDGGNNDTSFLRPDLSFVVVDALRPGHEMSYYPGETNFRMADVLVINKIGAAKPDDVRAILGRIAAVNPSAQVIESDLEIVVDDGSMLTGKRALVIEDGPTVTHGGMSFGAGVLAGRKFGVAEMIDPRSAAVGSIRKTFEKYPHLERVLPALGYSEDQRRELAETVRRVEPEVVIDASPAGLAQFLGTAAPIVRVRYGFLQRSGPPLASILAKVLDETSNHRDRSGGR